MNPSRIPFAVPVAIATLSAFLAGATSNGISIPNVLVMLAAPTAVAVALFAFIAYLGYWLSLRRQSVVPMEPKVHLDLPAGAVAAVEEAAKRAHRRSVRWRYYPCPNDPAKCRNNDLCMHAALLATPHLSAWIGHRLASEPAQASFVLTHEAAHLGRPSRALRWASALIVACGSFSVGRYLTDWWALAALAGVQVFMLAALWIDELRCDHAGVRAAGAGAAEAYLLGRHESAGVEEEEPERPTSRLIGMLRRHRTIRLLALPLLLLTLLLALAVNTVLYAFALMYRTHPPHRLRIWFAWRWDAKSKPGAH